MTPKIQKRIARVKSALELIQKKQAAAAKPSAKSASLARARALATAKAKAKAASAPKVKPRVALQTREQAGKGKPEATKVLPVVNNIDEKAAVLDKMLDSLVAALDSNNVNKIKTLMAAVIKKLRDLGSAADRLEPLTASARVRKAKAAKVVARGRAVVAKARKRAA